MACLRAIEKSSEESTKIVLDAATALGVVVLYFIAAETPLFLTSMNAPWIFLFVAAALSLAMRSLLPAAPALSASALIAASASAGRDPAAPRRRPSPPSPRP